MSGLQLAFSKDIGLASSQGARTYYYTLSDDLLRTLIMAQLGTERLMPLNLFVAKLYEDYHFVIGPAQAATYFNGTTKSTLRLEENDFAQNYQALKEKLQRLDLLLSLSDYCEYVQNPVTTHQ